MRASTASSRLCTSDGGFRKYLVKARATIARIEVDGMVRSPLFIWLRSLAEPQIAIANRERDMESQKSRGSRQLMQFLNRVADRSGTPDNGCNATTSLLFPFCKFLNFA